MFEYSIRSPHTKESYFRRLRRFFDAISLEGPTFESRCNSFAEKGKQDPNWAFNCILTFVLREKQRVENKEITGGTLRNSVKTIKTFCEVTDVLIPWKKYWDRRKMYNYTLNVNLDICLKIYTKVIQNIPKIDARISPDGISSDTSIINLFFTKPGSKIPIIKINITTTEVQLDKPTFNVSIIGTLDETENVDIPFAEVEVDQIMKDYKHLNPLIKEGISHSIISGRNPNRIASRSLVVKYRIFDRMYEDENYGYDIIEDQIAEAVLPYIISMQDIYSRIYPVNE
jgi:hypothetical protein